MTHIPTRNEYIIEAGVKARQRGIAHNGVVVMAADGGAICRNILITGYFVTSLRAFLSEAIL
jgi:hypothetical protein